MSGRQRRAHVARGGGRPHAHVTPEITSGKGARAARRDPPPARRTSAVRTGRRDRTIPPYAHTDGAERSTRPTGATATHAAAAGPPLRLKLFQPYIIKIIPPSSYVYPFVIHMRHLVPAAAPRWSLDLFSSAQCPTAWWWRPLVFFCFFFKKIGPRLTL